MKTIYDLPESMKTMYDITDSHECIGQPCYISLADKKYTIEANGITHRIVVENKVVITLWDTSKIMTIYLV